MPKEFLEDVLKQVTVRDMDKVSLPKAYGKFVDISVNTENPVLPGKVGSSNPSFLSHSTKFDKKTNDPIVRRTIQRGMYLMPAGKNDTMDCCKDKTSGCSASCLHNTGRLGQHQATQIARSHMLEQYPAEGLALIRHEVHTFAEQTNRESNRGLFLPSVRLDATSELHIDHMDAGDAIYGPYAKLRTEGPLKGQPEMVGSEYGKRYGKDVLPGSEPEMRQSNVRRVASWSERMTSGRAQQLTSRGLDIALPATNFGTSKQNTKLPSHIEVNFPADNKSLVLPAVDYDKHDIVWARRQTGAAGVLRAKSPGFGASLTPGEAIRSTKFLREHIASTPVTLSSSRHINSTQLKRSSKD